MPKVCRWLLPLLGALVLAVVVMVIVQAVNNKDPDRKKKPSREEDEEEPSETDSAPHLRSRPSLSEAQQMARMHERKYPQSSSQANAENIQPPYATSQGQGNMYGSAAQPPPKPHSGIPALDAASFQSEIKDKGSHAVVAFTAHGCGHCQQLMPELAKAQSMSKVPLFVMDADSAGKWPEVFKIGGYPTILKFAQGEAIAEYTEYPRTAASLAAFANS